MKKLLENWNKFLNEAIDPRIQKQIDALLALPDDIGILIEEAPGEGTSMHIVAFHYVKVLERKPLKFHRLQREDSTIYKDRKVIKTGIPHGGVEIWKTDDGECLNGWTVLESGAERGWGPLLYEVALEWASEHGGGLTADRGIVSKYALAVWDKYAARSDITVKQMDVDHTEKWMQKYDELTPDIKVDDCDQGKAIDLKGDKWMDTSVSKMFSKTSTPAMDTLRSAGRLIEE